MRRHLLAFSILSFLYGFVCPGFSQSASGHAQPSRAMNTTLMKATSPYEDMVEPALAGDEKKMTPYLAIADTEAPNVAKILPAKAAKNFLSLRNNLQRAARAKDGRAVAENSTDIFRLLVDNLTPDLLVVPVEVSLMDYAGYKFQVLAAAARPDWEAIAKLAAQNETWWEAIAKPRVSNKQLRASVTSAVRGAKTAAQEKNLGMLKLAAQMVLDLVDVLEIQYKYPLAEKPVKPAAPKP